MVAIGRVLPGDMLVLGLRLLGVVGAYSKHLLLLIEGTGVDVVPLLGDAAVAEGVVVFLGLAECDGLGELVEVILVGVAGEGRFLGDQEVPFAVLVLGKGAHGGGFLVFDVHLFLDLRIVVPFLGALELPVPGSF